MRNRPLGRYGFLKRAYGKIDADPLVNFASSADLSELRAKAAPEAGKNAAVDET